MAEATTSETATERKGKRASAASWPELTLLAAVFVSGVAVMALEMTASRLLAPYFGSTISVWTALIGLVMVFLTAGYYLGGSFADRNPFLPVLGLVVLAAGVVVVLVSLLSTPVLLLAWRLTPRLGLLASCLVGTALLFGLPNLLLGTVCPFAIKLSLSDVRFTGRASGRIYAVSAVGSVVGTFLPRLLTIGWLGVRHSILFFGVLLIVAGIVLIARVRFLPAAALGLLGFVPLGPMLPVKGLLAERESPYNYVQVVETKDHSRILVVDWGGFSFYKPGEFRTGEYYDYLLLAPLLRAEPPRDWLKRVLIVGLAAGTSAKQITQAYGPVDIDGVEIDPGIVELGRKYFDMQEPNLHVFTTDGRAFLAGAKQPYDFAIVDAYQGSDIPVHLVTREFFQQLKEHMNPGGVLAINLAWWNPKNPQLLQQLAATLQPLFPTVYAVTGISDRSGVVVLAGDAGASTSHLLAQATQIGHPGLLEIAREMVDDKPPALEVAKPAGEPLTDDRALVDGIVDRMYAQERRRNYDAEHTVLGL